MVSQAVENRPQMQFLDSHGWPVVTIKGRPIINFIRRILHTRKIKRGTWKQAPFVRDDSCGCQYSSVSPDMSCDVCDEN